MHLHMGLASGAAVAVFSCCSYIIYEGLVCPDNLTLWQNNFSESYGALGVSTKKRRVPELHREICSYIESLLNKHRP